MKNCAPEAEKSPPFQYRGVNPPSAMNTNWTASSMVWRGDSLPAKLLLAYCRCVPTFPGKGRIYYWISSLFFKNELRVRSTSGVRFNIDPRDFIGRTIVFEGNYEPLSLLLASRIMSRGGVFVDIGCNIGLYSLTVGVMPGVRGIAVDASFVALAKCSENLRQNPGIKTELVNSALCSEQAVHCFALPQKRNLGTTTASANIAGEDSPRFWAAGMPLQAILEKINPGPIRLVKIDVEGFELSVFRGLDFDGAFRPENLIVECDPDFPEALACIDFLADKGYEHFTVEGAAVTDSRIVPEHNLWFRSKSSS